MFKSEKMKKFQIGMTFMMLLFFVGSASAQTIDEGKSFLYYERFESAINVFQKILNSDPNNEAAAFWLGQAYLRNDDRSNQDVAKAKALYQQKLQANPNQALLIAGMGQIALIENQRQEARNRFETAISLSKGKDIDVLNAIGYANGNPNSKNGDAAYAIEKLKQATEVKKFKDPDVWVNLGDAYRKLNADGGSAIQAYNEALKIDPKYARALYRIGKVYQTQGPGQESIYMKYFNDAIAMDPKYAPVYYNLFSYYYETNVPVAAQYLDKWLANSDNDPKACYYQASVKFASGLFNETITEADKCISQEGENPYPKLFGLKAYAYNRLNDSLNAKLNFEEYLRRANPDNIGAGDYATYATILFKFPGNEGKATDLIVKAIATDTLVANKVAYAKTLAGIYDNLKNYGSAGKWFGEVVSLKKNFSNVDLFNAGYNYYLGNQYDSSSKYFTMYIQKYPDDILGYYMEANTSAMIDSTGELGLAEPFYNKVIEIGSQDLTKGNAKTRVLTAYKFFIGHQYNVKKNKDSALYYVNKALEIDPADAQLLNFKEIISKYDPSAPTPKKQPANKTSSPANSPKR